MKRTSGNGRYLLPSASLSNHPNGLPQRCSLIAEREIPRGQTFIRDLPDGGPLGRNPRFFHFRSRASGSGPGGPGAIDEPLPRSRSGGPILGDVPGHPLKPAFS